MAKLLLTVRERKELRFLDWDDEALGKAVKATAAILADVHNYDDPSKGGAAIKGTGAACFLISIAHAAKADEMTLTLRGAYEGDKQFGNWTIRITKDPDEP